MWIRPASWHKNSQLDNGDERTIYVPIAKVEVNWQTVWYGWHFIQICWREDDETEEGHGTCLGASSSVKFWKILINVHLISSNANLLPGQLLGPPPNAKKPFFALFWLAASSASQRSGTNSSTLSPQTALSWWMPYTEIPTKLPLGTIRPAQNSQTPFRHSFMI